MQLPLTSNMPTALRVLLALLAVAAVMAWELGQRPASPLARAAAAGASGGSNANGGGSPVDASVLQRAARGDIPMPLGAKAAHASSLLVMPPRAAAALTVFWFSGERESGPLVQIAASQWDRSSQAWLPPRVVANRRVLGEQLGYGLRRFGNPVAWHDAQGRIHVFVVATGWGGWAASRILHLRQSHAGQDLAALDFEPVRVLPLSWLWNISHLVRNAPLPLADGGMALPVHFELGLKYPVAVRMDAQGEFLGLTRISSRPYLLQPTLLAVSDQRWVALMRNDSANGKVGAATTDDAGRHWRDVPDLALDNPDASVAGMALRSGQLLLVHNSSVASRARLDLSVSTDGLRWSLLDTLANGAPADEFSYPAMAWADGSLWVSYTVDRERLAWQRYAVVPAVGVDAAKPKALP